MFAVSGVMASVAPRRELRGAGNPMEVDEAGLLEMEQAALEQKRLERAKRRQLRDAAKG